MDGDIFRKGLELLRELDELRAERQREWDRHAAKRAQGDAAWRRAMEQRSAGQVPIAAAMEWARPAGRRPVIG
jgi:hypothetical protein